MEDVLAMTIPEGARIVLVAPGGGERVINMQDMECTLTRKLQKFFTENEDAWNLVVDIVTRKDHGMLTLRLLDWFVCNYSFCNQVVYMRKSDGRPFHVFSEYKSMLRGYSKKFCDAFARTCRIFFEISSPSGNRRRIITSVGQLNFLKWAICNDVMDFAREHVHEIAAHMESTLVERSRLRQPHHRVRKKLSLPMMTHVQISSSATVPSPLN